MSPNEYCRLCGIYDGGSIDVFEEKDYNPNIIFKIRTLLCISVTKDDGLSHRICSSCIAKIQEYYLFTRKCQKMQLQWRNVDIIDTTVEKMEIEDCDNPINSIENIKLENDISLEDFQSHVEENRMFVSVGIDKNTNVNTTRSYQNDLSALPKCDRRMEPRSVVENTTIKMISYSKLVEFLRSKVKISPKIVKQTPALDNALENTSEHLEITSENNLNSSGEDSIGMATTNADVEPPTDEEVNPSYSERNAYNAPPESVKDLTTIAAVHSNPIRSISTVPFLRSNKSSKENSSFKRKIIFLKSKKIESTSRKKKKDKNTIKCPYCGEIFTRREFEEEHMTLHTDDTDLHKIILDHISPFPSTKQLDCEECKMVFYRELAYIEHMNKHADLRPVKCHICDRRYFGHKRTRSHFRNAHLVSTFKCESCSYVAKTSRDLDTHKRGVHTDERIVCNICGKLLSAYSHNVKKHLETHDESRPYKCDCCDASFKTSSSVARHRENIHFPQPVMCSACGTVCNSKQKYKKHSYKCRKRLKKINL